MDEETKLKWDFILEEYKSLREEELNKMDKQYTIVSLGVGSIGVLLALAFEKGISSLFLILPLIIISSMSLFDAERGAIRNVGKYVYFLEENIIGEEGFIAIMGWERWLEERKNSGYLNPNIKIKDQRRKPYINFDCACLSVLLFYYLACVYGIIIMPNEGVIRLEFFDSITIRYLVAGIYIILGLWAYILYNREFFDRLSGW
jgi:hypothetical protein